MPAPTSPPAFFDALQAFIVRERAAQDREEKLRWALPPDERVEMGRAIGDLRLVEVTSDARRPRWIFRCAPNTSRIRPGDEVVLTRPDDPTTEGGVFRVVEDLEPERLVLQASDPRSVPSEAHVREGAWIADPRALDLWDYVADGVERARPNAVLATDLAGGHTLGVDEDMRAFLTGSARQNPYLRGLDPTQLAAATLGASARTGALVQGPPGTGKTRTLSALACLLARQGKRVAVASFTHAAADNIVRKLREVDPAYKVAVARVGARGPQPEGVGVVDKHQDLPAGPLVAVSTAHKLALSRGRGFDVVLLDEATQLVLPLAVAAMARAPRWVLFGDHRQMAPVILATDHEEWARRSAFEHFLGRAPHVMLEMCRRMCRELIRYSSDTWYEGRVGSAPDVASRRIVLRGVGASDDPVLARIDAALAPETPGVVVRLEHTGNTQVNPTEAEFVARLVTRAVERGLPPGEIAVVTPYRRHEREVRSRLHARLGPRAAEVRVDTVERIQGDERELIVVSLCDSSPGGSLSELHLNVALTRAKSKRVVVGGARLFDARGMGGVWARVADLGASDPAA